MKNQNMPVCAAIDVGSNTIRIVVARCAPDHLEVLASDEEMVRIGESVNATGEISSPKCEAAIATLLRYKALATQHHASPILVVATEAIRQAKNRDSFLHHVREATGLEVQLIEGDVEATLTFFGATSHLSQEVHVPARVGVMDLGGGSLELALAKNMHVTWRTSVPIGSGWLHDRYLASDPPDYDDLSVAMTFLLTYLQGVRLKQSPPVLIVTGGSANTLLRLMHQAFQLHEQETRLTYDDVLHCEGLLSAMSAVEIARRYTMPEARARVLCAGALIIRAVMVWLELREIRISAYGIREGLLLAYARYGSQWKRRIQESTQGQAVTDVKTDSAGEEKAEEPFTLSGHRMLLERTHKMLEWRSDVLKHEDIEAVHRMRVASRRLRAVLDAYELACQPKLFKKAYRRVKKLADILGKARDTDVMIAHLQVQLEQGSAEEKAGIHWLIERLQAYRWQHQEMLETFLKRINEDAWTHKIMACLPAGGDNNGKSQAHYES